MPIPNAQRAVVERDKVCDYLLNPEHPDGGSKAAWFHGLGYQRSDWQALAQDLLSIAQSCDHFDVETSPFGIKYIVSGTISRCEGRMGRVLIVWIAEDNSPPRLVTAYPSH